MAGLSISLDGISKSFGGEPVLSSVDLSVREGELVSLLGPSGCGKSTLLRIVAGLERQQAGSVRLGGRAVDALPAGARDLAMVFQSYALYPHMSVAENIGLSLEMTELTTLRRLPLVGRFLPGTSTIRRAIEKRVIRTARLTEIEHLLKRRPAQLSGGQRQRVALARAIVREPGVFLMDEPLSNLDAKLRVAMREEIVDLNRRLGATFLFVTHDQSDAMAMSDRIALMMGGRIRQIGTPQEIYEAPSHIEVASFIGQPAINLFDAAIDGAGQIRLDGAHGPLATCALPAGPCQVGVRAEAFEPLPSKSARAAFALAAHLDRVERMGAEILLRCRLAATGQPTVCRLTPERFDALSAGGVLSGKFLLATRERGVHVFAADGRAAAHRPTPSACLVVEDSLFGLTAARAAGMRVAAYLGASHQTSEMVSAVQEARPDFTLGALPDLLAVLRQPNRAERGQ